MGAMLSVRIVIADDDHAIRERLRSLTESFGAAIVAEARNGREAVDACELLLPDLILLDIGMPVMGGFMAARRLRTSLPELRIVFVSQYAEPAYVEEALRVGATGYVLKSAAGTDLRNAMVATLSGQTFVSPFSR